jgi:gas vesicle protein
MDAAMVTAIAALIGGPVAAAAAMYGTRGASRAAREGNAVNGFNSLTDQLQEERKELRADLATVRAELAAERAEVARLKALVVQLGGHP